MSLQKIGKRRKKKANYDFANHEQGEKKKITSESPSRGGKIDGGKKTSSLYTITPRWKGK